MMVVFFKCVLISKKERMGRYGSKEDNVGSSELEDLPLSSFAEFHRLSPCLHGFPFGSLVFSDLHIHASRSTSYSPYE